MQQSGVKSIELCAENYMHGQSWFSMQFVKRKARQVGTPYKLVSLTLKSLFAAQFSLIYNPNFKSVLIRKGGWIIDSANGYPKKSSGLKMI